MYYQTPKLTYANPADPLPRRVAITCLEYLFGRNTLQNIYNEVLRQCDVLGHTFWEAALACLNIQVDCNRTQLELVPEKGPVILIANHPFGVVDGIIACHIAQTVRKEFKILINSVLTEEKRIKDHMLPIDFGNTRESQLVNLRSRKEALNTLKDDGAIIIFPAGGVATSAGFFGPAKDLEWRLFVTKLIQQSKATVVPMYFHGQNSRLFQIVSQFSYTLRLAMLLNEVRNKMGRTIHLQIGEPIPYATLPQKRRNDLLDYLREQTFLLSQELLPKDAPSL